MSHVIVLASSLKDSSDIVFSFILFTATVMPLNTPLWTLCGQTVNGVLDRMR